MRRTNPRFRTFKTLSTLCLVGLFSGTGHADVVPNALFGDHAVLQQGIAIPVWGSADSGESVSVSLGDESLTVTADGNRRWLVYLVSREAGGPHILTIEGSVFQNVMIGEVWVCSGQSNVAMSVRNSNKANAEIAASDWPDIRLFSVKRTVAGKPLMDVVGEWSVSSPESIPGFSAVAYYFGRDIHQMTEVPVGLIHTSWGGTPSDAWTSRPYLESTGDLYTERFEQWTTAIEAFPEKNAAYLEKWKAWEATRDSLREIDQKVPRRPRAPWGPAHPHRPAGLYNGMISPLIPYGIRGAIWYQGESNAGRAYQYRTLFPLMIRNWRNDWGQGNFPFYFVQLANYREVKDEPGESDWAELREAQSTGICLNWRYVDIPKHHYRTIRNASGFAIFRFESIKDTDEKVLRILEWGFQDCDSQEMMNTLLDVAKEERAILADFFCSSTAIGQAFERMGFLNSDDTGEEPIPYQFRPLNQAPGIEMAIDFPPHRKRRSFPFASWYITKGDGDIDREKI
jgi:sialate O-acetylesterase